MKLFSLSFFYICNEIVQKWDPCTLLACATDAFSSNPVFLLKFIAMGLKFLSKICSPNHILSFGNLKNLTNLTGSTMSEGHMQKQIRFLKSAGKLQY